MAVNKIQKRNGDVLIDLTSDTVSAETLLQGYTAHDKTGTLITGTASEGPNSQKIYSGSSTPSSSLGDNGDIYFKFSTGASSTYYPYEYTYANMNSSHSALGNCIGVSAENGTSTSNVYSSGNNVTGTADYTFDVSGIPSSATIKNVSLSAKAHEENASRSVCTIQVFSGSTAKGDETTVNGTSNNIYDVDCGTSWTRQELDNLIMRLSLGYYGGLIAGATLTIEYETEKQWAATIIGTEDDWALSGSEIYKKDNGAWTVVNQLTLSNVIERV